MKQIFSQFGVVKTALVIINKYKKIRVRMKILKWMLVGCLASFTMFSQAKDVSVVLMYHQIAHYKNDMNTTPELFKQQMEYLYENNYNVVPAMDLVEAITKKKALPPKSVIITFDDGWATQKAAMEVLKKYNYPAMFALITEYQTFKNRTYLQRDDIEKYGADNFTFVNHSHTHFVKDFLGFPEHDVETSKAQIIRTTGKFVPIYVYPYGKKNKELIEALKKNSYIAGFGVYSYPVNVKTANIFNINRYLMNDKVDLERFKQIVSQTDPIKEEQKNATL